MAKHPERILCQVCGIEAPTRYIEFHQNIGMLVARRMQTLRGNLCKNCVHSKFWKMTGTTLAVGWLGTISIILAPFIVLINLVRYLSVLGMPAVPAGAKKPVLDNDVVTRVFPFMPTVMERLNAGQTLATVAKEVGPAAGVTPGQVVMYVAAQTQADRAAAVPQKPTGGFPVLPANTTATIAPPPMPVADSLPDQGETSPQVGPSL